MRDYIFFWTCDATESSEIYEQVIFDEILTFESLKSIAKVRDDYVHDYGFFYALVPPKD